eukprot:2970321-Alexandrium_andersonii.AAC.1
MEPFPRAEWERIGRIVLHEVLPALHRLAAAIKQALEHDRWEIVLGPLKGKNVRHGNVQSSGMQTLELLIVDALGRSVRKWLETTQAGIAILRLLLREEGSRRGRRARKSTAKRFLTRAGRCQSEDWHVSNRQREDPPAQEGPQGPTDATSRGCEPQQARANE